MHHRGVIECQGVLKGHVHNLRLKPRLSLSSITPLIPDYRKKASNAHFHTLAVGEVGGVNTSSKSCGRTSVAPGNVSFVVLCPPRMKTSP